MKGDLGILVGLYVDSKCVHGKKRNDKNCESCSSSHADQDKDESNELSKGSSFYLGKCFSSYFPFLAILILNHIHVPYC